LKCQINLTKFD